MIKEVIKGYIRNTKGFVQEDVDTILQTLYELKGLHKRVRSSSLSNWKKILSYILLVINILFISVVTLVCISAVIAIKMFTALVLFVGAIPYNIMLYMLDKQNK